MNTKDAGSRPDELGEHARAPERLPKASAHLSKELMLARVKRWWYLLTRGMWLGERAADYRYLDGSLAMLTSENGDGIKVWWRKEVSSSKQIDVRRWSGPDANNVVTKWVTFRASDYDKMRSDETSRCMHGRVVCEPCAQMAIRTYEKVREIKERHDRVSNLLWGPASGPGMILGPMDSDAAHNDRGTLLSMLTPEQRGERQPEEPSLELSASEAASFAKTLARSPRRVELSPKPARDAEHCDYPDCEQHWTAVVDMALAAMKALHEAAEPDTDHPEIPAIISTAAFRAFVDEHARLMRIRALGSAEKASDPQPGDVLGTARMIYTGKLPPRKLDDEWCMHLVKYSECSYGCTPENGE